MKSVVLNNGIEMPILGFGTFLTGGTECESSVLSAIGAGYRLIDTAEAYGNEDAVGAAITKCGVARSDLFITTKINFRSYENTAQTVESSLKKLNVDSILTSFCSTGLSVTTTLRGGS